MPQERNNPYPYPTAEEVEAAPGDPATKAARNIMVRHITGVPRRSFLMGDNDHAPVLQGVADLTRVCLAVIEAIPADQLNGTLRDRVGELQATLDHHGCPTQAQLAAEVEAVQAAE